MSKKHSRAPDGVKVLGEKRHPPQEVSGPDPILIADIEASRAHVRFSNVGGVTIYIGKHTLDDPAVVLSPLNGIPLLVGGLFEDDSSYDQWWAITADGALGQVVVMETLAKSVPAPVFPAPPDYTNRVLATGPIAGWIMGEAAGLVSIDQVNSPAQDGTYQGVTLGQPGIGDGNTCPLFDGVNDYMSSFGASLDGVFNGEELTILAWGRVFNAGVWTDGTTRYLFQFMETNGNNRVSVLRQGLVNNRIDFTYVANGVAITPNTLVLGGITDWFSTTITASRTADEVRIYGNGIQIGATINGLGNWDSSGVVIANQTVVGARITTPADVWNGYLAHNWMWDRALPPAEVLNVGVL